MGDVIVAGIEAGDHALQELKALDVKVAGFHQTDIVIDVISEGAIAFNADHVAVLGAHRSVDQLDHLLGLAGTLLAHDDSNHSVSLLVLVPSENSEWD